MQTKTAMIYHCTATETAIIKERKEIGTLFIANGNINCSCDEKAWFLKPSKMELSYDSATLLPGVYLRELEIHVHTITCKQIATVASFMTAKTRKLSIVRQRING